MSKSKIIALALAVTCASIHVEARAMPPCEPTAEGSRHLVLSFYKLALVDKQPKVAFERYVSPDFIEHKPDVPGSGRTAVVAFLEGLMEKLPCAEWEILRTVAEKEFVFLHARFTPAPGAQPSAIADVFRIQNCAIVEHWDVVGPPREGQPNPNSRF